MGIFLSVNRSDRRDAGLQKHEREDDKYDITIDRHLFDSSRERQVANLTLIAELTETTGEGLAEFDA